MNNRKTLAPEIMTSVVKLLERQKAHDLCCNSLTDLGIDIMDGLSFDCVDFIADLVGWPPDNTVETNACEIANATGEWPGDAVCRDWIYDAWNRVTEGSWTVEKFLEYITREYD
jgi:hypothetical protein